MPENHSRKIQTEVSDASKTDEDFFLIFFLNVSKPNGKIQAAVSNASKIE